MANTNDSTLNDHTEENVPETNPESEGLVDIETVAKLLKLVKDKPSSEDKKKPPTFLRPELKKAGDLNFWKSLKSSNRHRYDQLHTSLVLFMEFQEKWMSVGDFNAEMVQDWNKGIAFMRNQLEMTIAAEKHKLGWKLFDEEIAKPSFSDPEIGKRYEENQKALKATGSTVPFRAEGYLPPFFKSVLGQGRFNYQASQRGFQNRFHPYQTPGFQPNFVRSNFRVTSQPGPCFSCGQSGHLARSCPNSAQQQQRK